MSGRPGLGPAGLAALAAACLQAAAAQPSYHPPLERFVTNRPRLFINAGSFSAVTQAASHAHGAWLSKVRDHVSRVEANTNLPAGDYGVESAAAAFLFLRERTPERLSMATGLLERSIGYYQDCDRKGCVVSHYSTTRIHAITAYDWLYDALPKETRTQFGHDLLTHVAHRVLDRRAAGDNLSDYRSGFYGETSLPWYVGIATRGTGIDEEKSAAAIAFGYDQQMRMLEHRRRLTGDDGGGATTTLGYALRADPWAEFNFFHTMKSAFGLDMAADWPHVALLPNYVLWNRLPGNLEFGAGDAFHDTNKFPEEHLYTHLAQIRHFYGRSHPEQAALAAWLQAQCRRPSYNPAWPLTPFLLTELDYAPPPRAPSATLPLARHFKDMGQIFMRSGWSYDDTFALFTAGGQCERHKHFDENTFAIYHKGFLALDTGTRPLPGSHLFQYYCRTVAHNGLLIRMEGEHMPNYDWGTPAPGEPVLPVVNDGGMRSWTGAVIRAFRTTPDYTYIASDATACYHPGKCRVALRQFVHVQPDLFVVFDRVTAVEPEYRKTWLLHTAQKPRVTGLVVTAEHGAGRLFCRTLLPTNAVIEAVGGSGKEFWNDGRDWPLPDNTPRAVQLSDLMGAWRVEVSPVIPAREDCFLHLIEVGSLSKTNMTPARLLSATAWRGVEFQSGERKISVRFRKRGDVFCEIRIEGEGRDLAETLDNTIQPQSEWAATGR